MRLIKLLWQAISLGSAGLLVADLIVEMTNMYNRRFARTEYALDDTGRTMRVSYRVLRAGTQVEMATLSQFFPERLKRLDGDYEGYEYLANYSEMTIRAKYVIIDSAIYSAYVSCRYEFDDESPVNAKLWRENES